MCVLNVITNCINFCTTFMYFRKLGLEVFVVFHNLFRLNKFLHIKFITIINYEGRNVYCLINKKLILKKFIYIFLQQFSLQIVNLPDISSFFLKK